VPHRTRRELNGHTPVHLTLRMENDIARLRKRDQYREIRTALRRSGHRSDFRIVHFSIQGNHVHLVCEPLTKDALARGMMSFKSSCAKRLNRLAGRHGRVFADRYHVRYLENPAQVRNALCYVLRGSIKTTVDARSCSGDQSMWTSRPRTSHDRSVVARVEIPSLASRPISRIRWTASVDVRRFCSMAPIRRVTFYGSSTVSTSPS
jgi:REP element-mobilizing transposase RayT